MSANKFEEDIEQRLAQLQLKPSDGVWQKLETGLQRKKRRRVFFLFFLATLLCTGGTVWLVLPTGNHTPGIANIPHRSNDALANDVLANEGTPVSGNITAAISETTATIVAKEKRTKDTITSVKIPQQNSILKVSPVKKQPDNTLVNNSSPIHLKTKTVLPVKKIKAHNLHSLPANTNIQHTRIPATGALLTGAGINNLPDHNPLIRSGRAANNGINLPQGLNGFSGSKTYVLINKAGFPQPVATGEQLEKKTKKKYPYYWGVEVIAGVSGAFEKRESVDKSALRLDATYNWPSNGTGYAGLSPVAVNSPIWDSENLHRASTAHSFGVVAYKQLSKRNALSVGLSYQYLSTATKIGDSTTTVNTNGIMRTYYLGSGTRNHINKFHFINLPVTHHLILNKNENMPLSWDLGFSAGQLLSTTSLVSSSYLGGSFHEDKNAFTKTHFFIHTGLTIGLTNNQNRIWQLGPVLNYGLNRIGLQDGDDKKFWEIGLKLRCLLQ